MMPTQSDIAREKKWEAEEDAHTLARAEEILKKKGRLKAAKTAARRMAKEQQERATALKNVAGGVKIMRKMGTNRKKMGARK